MKLRQTNGIAATSAKAGFSTATGYRIAQEPVLPSQRAKTRERRRPDLLAELFEHEIVPLLKTAPGLRAMAIFEEMRWRHPISMLGSDAPWNGASAPGGAPRARAGGDISSDK